MRKSFCNQCGKVTTCRRLCKIVVAELKQKKVYIILKSGELERNYNEIKIVYEYQLIDGPLHAYQNVTHGVAHAYGE
jgi:hypothetical protein